MILRNCGTRGGEGMKVRKIADKTHAEICVQSSGLALVAK